MGSTVQLRKISPASKGPMQHFHRPGYYIIHARSFFMTKYVFDYNVVLLDIGMNIYKKPPIYKHGNCSLSFLRTIWIEFKFVCVLMFICHYFQTQIPEHLKINTTASSNRPNSQQLNLLIPTYPQR